MNVKPIASFIANVLVWQIAQTGHHVPEYTIGGSCCRGGAPACAELNRHLSMDVHLSLWLTVTPTMGE